MLAEMTEMDERVEMDMLYCSHCGWALGRIGAESSCELMCSHCKAMTRLKTTKENVVFLMMNKREKHA